MPTRSLNHLARLLPRPGAWTLALLLWPTLLPAVEPWPAEAAGTNITASGPLPGHQELSGAVWNSLQNRLYVVDDDSGRISSMDRDGGKIRSWTVRLFDVDHEAVTFADERSQVVYVGVEQSPRGTAVRKVRKFYLKENQKAVLLQEWTLPEMASGPANAGLEGLTFVPDAFLSQFPDSTGQAYNGGKGSRLGSGGLFLAGLQANGTIYVYDLDIVGNTSKRIYVGRFTPVPNRDDLSELTFDRATGLLYCLWDKANRLAAWTLPTVTEPAGHAVKEWQLWDGGNERSDEGLAIAHSSQPGGKTQLFVLDDRGEDIWRFELWPDLPAAKLPAPLPAPSSPLPPGPVSPR